jgi:hypothetical protein
MAVPTPAIHVARDQNHLAWDPAIPPVWGNRSLEPEGWRWYPGR